MPMKHNCRCNPLIVYRWTLAELQAAHEAHPDGLLRGEPPRARKYEIRSTKLNGQDAHRVWFVEVT